MSDSARLLASVCKLRIGVVITLSALAGMVMTPGALPGAWNILAFALAVLAASASAGAFNQYAERDLDARMPRTANRPFVTGRFGANGYWFCAIVLMLSCAILATTVFTNAVAALFVFLGAFTYGIVYTVWLKRRTWMNIVIGGLSGSFAVLAGAATVDPSLSPAPMLLALTLFLWTPPHFWSLAHIHADDYAGAGVPMLPVVVSPRTSAWVIFVHTFLLVVVSLLPIHYGLGGGYAAGAISGGFYFLLTSYRFARAPSIANARRNFLASLIQLTLLLTGALIDAGIN